VRSWVVTVAYEPHVEHSVTNPAEPSAARSSRITVPNARLLRATALTLGAWTLVGLLTTELAVLAIERSGNVASWRSLLTANLVSVWLWAAFTPAMVFMAGRFPPGESAWPRWIVPHLLGTAGLGVADVILERVIWSFLPLPPATDDLVTLFLRRLFPNSLCYIAVVAISAVVRYSRISREREATATRLSGQLSAARLQALQAQLRPHFLFNTLSMIAEQVHTDPAGADRMIGRLGYLLRASLASTERHEITLAEEMRFLQAYLDIMAVRLRGRVDFALEIEPDCLEAGVPALLLQPLVENAYRHGIERVTRFCFLRIAARRDGGALEIEIADNGAGFDTKQVHEGLGVRIVRDRLAQMYGHGGSLLLEPKAPSGAVSTVRIPFKRLAAWNAGSDEDAFIHELAE
jgi:two-component system, LytTR family, sensor kinase